MSASDELRRLSEANGWVLPELPDLPSHRLVDPVALNTVKNAWLIQDPHAVGDRWAALNAGQNRQLAEDDTTYLEVLWLARQMAGLLALELSRLDDERLQGTIARATLGMIQAALRTQGRDVPAWERVGLRIKVRPDHRDVQVSWQGRMIYRVTERNRGALDHDIERGFLDRPWHVDRSPRVTWGELATGVLEGPEGQGHDRLAFLETAIAAWDTAFGEEVTAPAPESTP